MNEFAQGFAYSERENSVSETKKQFEGFINKNPIIKSFRNEIADHFLKQHESSVEDLLKKEITLDLQGALLRLDLKNFSKLFQKYTSLDAKQPLPPELMQFSFVLNAIKNNPDVLAMMQEGQQQSEKVTVEKQMGFINKVTEILKLPHGKAADGAFLSVEGDAMVFHFKNLNEAIKAGCAIHEAFEDPQNEDLLSIKDEDPTKTEKIGARIGIVELSDKYKASVTFNADLPFPILQGNAFAKVAEVEKNAVACNNFALLKEYDSPILPHKREEFIAKHGIAAETEKYITPTLAMIKDEDYNLTSPQPKELPDNVMQSMQSFFTSFDRKDRYDHNIRTVVTYVSVEIPPQKDEDTNGVNQFMAKVKEVEDRYGIVWAKAGTGSMKVVDNSTVITLVGYHTGMIDAQSAAPKRVNAMKATSAALLELESLFPGKLHAGIVEGQVVKTTNAVSTEELYGTDLNKAARLAQLNKHILAMTGIKTDAGTMDEKYQKPTGIEDILGEEKSVGYVKGVDGEMQALHIASAQQINVEKESINVKRRTTNNITERDAYNHLYALTHPNNPDERLVNEHHTTLLAFLAAMTGYGKIPLSRERAEELIQRFYGQDFVLHADNAKELLLEQVINNGDESMYAFSPEAAKILTDFMKHTLPGKPEEVKQLFGPEDEAAKIMYFRRIDQLSHVQTEIKNQIKDAFEKGKLYTVIHLGALLEDEDAEAYYYTGLAAKEYGQLERAIEALEFAKDTDDSAKKFRAQIELAYLKPLTSDVHLKDEIENLDEMEKKIQVTPDLEKSTQEELLYYLHVARTRLANTYGDRVNAEASFQYFEDKKADFNPETSSLFDALSVLRAEEVSSEDLDKIWEFILANNTLGFKAVNGSIEDNLDALFQYAQQSNGVTSEQRAQLLLLQETISMHIWVNYDLNLGDVFDANKHEAIGMAYKLGQLEYELVKSTENVRLLGDVSKNVAYNEIILAALQKCKGDIEGSKILVNQAIHKLEEVQRVYSRILKYRSSESMSTTRNLVLAMTLKGEDMNKVKIHINQLMAQEKGITDGFRSEMKHLTQLAVMLD